MKRLLSFLMAVVLVLSLGVTAFADGDDLGSITITNATIGQTYAPYKIFDASISGGEEGGYIYYMETTNQFFKTMFGDPTDPNNKFDQNEFFIYDAATKQVTMRATAARESVIAYLKGLIYEVDENDRDGDNDKTDLVVREGLTPAKTAVTAADKTLVFDDLAYGYYLITSTLGTTVTIDSTNPDVKVIDKNQKPGDNFTKMVFDEDYTGPDADTWIDEDDVTHTGRWVTSSSANIGDIVDFKVDFHATNYNGEFPVQYYVVGDTKGSALWVEFDEIVVEVNGVKLDRGYYHAVDGTHKTQEWEFFGNWTDSEKANPAQNAQWYMVHRGFDEFDIVIPWMSDHTFEGTSTDFNLTFGDDAESIYPASSIVTVKYCASVEPSADIVNGSNLFNTADLSWKDKVVVTPPGTPTTNLTVHAMGVTKTDGSNGNLLAGATFEIYKSYDAASKTYSDPVYVIPTNIKGVYILDDLYTIVSGELRETSRKKYAAYLTDYLQGETQKNEVVTQVNGKLVVLGLEADTYYLKETAAPAGYNLMTTAVTVVVPNATKTEPFSFDVDKDGNVVTENAVKTEIYENVVNEPVTNNKGAQLPSTGGEGTMKMITIGTAIAIGFAILLITNKKMTAYQD